MEGWVDLVDLIAPRPECEPATFRSRVRRRTAATPRQLGYIHNYRYTDRWQRCLHSLICPQVAAACSGVHCSESRALTSAPLSISSLSNSSRSSIQHCQQHHRPAAITHTWQLNHVHKLHGISLTITPANNTIGFIQNSNQIKSSICKVPLKQGSDNYFIYLIIILFYHCILFYYYHCHAC